MTDKKPTAENRLHPSGCTCCNCVAYRAGIPGAKRGRGSDPDVIAQQRIKLTKEQLHWLKWLHENGGRGWIDNYGRVVANGVNSKQGSQTAWLNLFVKGMVLASEQRVILSPRGYEAIGALRVSHPAAEPWEDGTPTTVDYDNDCAP